LLFRHAFYPLQNHNSIRDLDILASDEYMIHHLATNVFFLVVFAAP
jgi:hypothetical protein